MCLLVVGASAGAPAPASAPAPAPRAGPHLNQVAAGASATSPGVGAHGDTVAGDRDAWYYLRAQLGFGPRNPGSPGHRKAIEFLKSELARYADEVMCEEFEVRHEGARYPMANVAGLFRSSASEDTPFAIIGAHFDTRPRAEFDPDPARRLWPIQGANDGASGVAVLLELAGALARARPPVPVMLVFFDGEDFGETTDRMFLGSRRFAQDLAPSSVRYMILVDMVGDADLDIYIEGHSNESCPRLVSRAWSWASRLGYGHIFHDEVLHYVLDDHVPFIERGIPSMDIIDFDYPYWHTTMDTEDKCSRESLRVVGDVLLSVIFDEEIPRLLER